MKRDKGLPASWALVPLANLLTGIETGKSFKCDERPPSPAEIGVVKVSAVSWGEYQERESKTCTDATRINPALFVQPGDFLFSRANTIELVGACVIAQQVSLRVMLSDKILRFRFISEATKPWVLNLLGSEQGRSQIEALASGNQDSMRNIGQARIGQILVPVPPAAEQTRIVEKLEALLSDLDAGVAELKAAQRKLAQYRQSLLKAAVEGALTADWRATRAKKLPPPLAGEGWGGGGPKPVASPLDVPPSQPSPASGGRGEGKTGAQLLQRILTERRASWEAKQLAKFADQGKTPPAGWQAKYAEPVVPDTTDLPPLPEDWVWTSLDQIVSESLIGLDRGVAHQSKTDGGVRYVKMNNISMEGQIDVTELVLIDATQEEIKRYSVIKGDLLFNTRNSKELVGKTGIIGHVAAPAVFNNNLMRLRLDGAATPEFVCSQMCSASFRSRMEKVKKATTSVAAVYARDLFPLSVALPPMDEQLEICSLLATQMEMVDHQAREISTGLKQAAAQRKNLLKAAFAGHLVPQDPNDEPASVLLERIRAERAANPIKRGRKAREHA